MSTSTSTKDNDIENSASGTRLLMRARSSLLATTIYLGRDFHDIDERVEWQRVGLADRLLIKKSQIGTMKIEKEETTMENTSKEIENVGVDIDTESSLEPALLSMIVLIDSDNCWLTPCGNWKGPTKITKKFEDVKLSFLGKAPIQEFLADDFDCVAKNSKRLMDMVTKENGKTTGFLIATKSGERAIRFRHAVFEVCGNLLYSEI